jgi:hypothetical protein
MNETLPIGKALRNIIDIVKKDLSYLEFCKQNDLNNTSLSTLFNSDKNITPAFIDICKKFNVNLNYFVDNNEPMFKENKEEILNTVPVNLYYDIDMTPDFFLKNENKQRQITYFDKSFLKDMFNIKSFENLDLIKISQKNNLSLINEDMIFIERCKDYKNGDILLLVIENQLYTYIYHKIPFKTWFTLEDPQTKEKIEINSNEKLSLVKIIGIVKKRVTIV